MLYDAIVHRLHYACTMITITTSCCSMRSMCMRRHYGFDVIIEGRRVGGSTRGRLVLAVGYLCCGFYALEVLRWRCCALEILRRECSARWLFHVVALECDW